MTRCAVCGGIVGWTVEADRVCSCSTPDPAIPASRVRELARAWTSRVRGDDMYQDGRIDARNECADALDALLRDAGVES